MSSLIARAIPISFLVCIQPAVAQSSAQVPRGDRSVGAWIGVSPSSRVGQFARPRRQLVLIGAHAEWVVESWRALALATTTDIFPAAVVTHTPTYIVRQVVTPGGGTFQLKEENGSKPVYGAGAAPFGFKLYLASSPRVRLFGSTAVGGLWFTRDMPIPDARRFNISFEYGGGVAILWADRRAIILGYKFHHLSNANSAAVNPGLDSNVFYLGLSRSR